MIRKSVKFKIENQTISLGLRDYYINLILWNENVQKLNSKIQFATEIVVMMYPRGFGYIYEIIFKVSPSIWNNIYYSLVFIWKVSDLYWSSTRSSMVLAIVLVHTLDAKSRILLSDSSLYFFFFFFFFSFSSLDGWSDFVFNLMWIINFNY